MRSKLVVGGLKRELQTLEGSLDQKTVKKKGSGAKSKSKTTRRNSSTGGSSAHVRRKAGLG